MWEDVWIDMQNAVYLMLRMVHRAVDRCPPCLPSPYGPVCVRTDPSLSYPSRKKTHTHTHTHTGKCQGNGKGRGYDGVREWERSIGVLERNTSLTPLSFLVWFSLSSFLHITAARPVSTHSIVEYSRVRHSTAQHSALTCSTRVTSG